MSLLTHSSVFGSRIQYSAALTLRLTSGGNRSSAARAFSILSFSNAPTKPPPPFDVIWCVRKHHQPTWELPHWIIVQRPTKVFSRAAASSTAGTLFSRTLTRALTTHRAVAMAVFVRSPDSTVMPNDG